MITVDASKSEGAEITSNPEEFELILAPSYESQDAFKDALMAALSKAHISSRYIWKNVNNFNVVLSLSDGIR